MLLVLLVDATEVDESESDDESDPSSESDEEDDDDEDDSGDLPGGFESTGFVLTVVILVAFFYFFSECYLTLDPVDVPTRVCDYVCPRGFCFRLLAVKSD